MPIIAAFAEWDRAEAYEVEISPLDWGWVSRYRWRINRQGYVYRATSVRQPGKPWPVRRNVYLHREIMGLEYGDPLQVDHLNRDPADNRRENLEVVTQAENLRRQRLYTEGEYEELSLATGDR